LEENRSLSLQTARSPTLLKLRTDTALSPYWLQTTSSWIRKSYPALASSSMTLTTADRGLKASSKLQGPHIRRSQSPWLRLNQRWISWLVDWQSKMSNWAKMRSFGPPSRVMPSVLRMWLTISWHPPSTPSGNLKWRNCL
jgi:hypothetical protein